MEIVNQWLASISGLFWSFPTVALLVGTGIYLSVGTRFFALRQLPRAIRLTWHSARHQRHHEVSPFRALMTALSATVGTGNIVGVAVAISLGGPGAVFWMWITALVGATTKFAEAVMAVEYREIDEDGERLGGPMYFIRNALGKRWAWLAASYALFGAIAAFGIGNLVQSHAIANNIYTATGIPKVVTALVLFALVTAVVVGGITRLARVAGVLVPFMGLFYVSAALIILLWNLPQIPDALALIFHSAFYGHAAAGGFMGATIAAAIRFGMARGVFSNEAGLGSASIAHAASSTNNPMQQGLVATLGVIIDTLIVCSMTALVVLTSGLWQQQGVSPNVMTQVAFAAHYGPVGSAIVVSSLVLFGYTTILGWGFYGERCSRYLLGKAWSPRFRIAWCIVVPVGALVSLEPIWHLADIFNALMAAPNLIGLLLISPVLFALVRRYRDQKETAD